MHISMNSNMYEYNQILILIQEFFSPVLITR